MNHIEKIMDNILSCVLVQSEDMEKTDAREMSEAMDMIKDLAMANYYYTITENMTKTKSYPLDSAEDWIKGIKEDAMELVTKMNADEKQLMRQKLINIANTIPI